MTRTHATPPGTSPADATVTVSVWHNVTRDSAGHPTGYFGFTPGDQMVKVFTYDTRSRGRHLEDIAEDAFAAFNDLPRGSEGQNLARQYRARRLRSVSRGDLITVGEAALIVERAGVQPPARRLHPRPPPRPRHSPPLAARRPDRDRDRRRTVDLKRGAGQRLWPTRLRLTTD